MPRDDKTQPGTPRTGISNRLSPAEEAAERREHPPRSDQKPAAGAGDTDTVATPADQEASEEAARDESGE